MWERTKELAASPWSNPAAENFVGWRGQVAMVKMASAPFEPGEMAGKRASHSGAMVNRFEPGGATQKHTP